jgi:hypothetical protein
MRTSTLRPGAQDCQGRQPPDLDDLHCYVTEKPMAKKWLYDTSGGAAYYQKGKYLYSASTSTCEYWIKGKYVYAMEGGECIYFIKGKWLYNMKGGGPVYYYG